MSQSPVMSAPLAAADEHSKFAFAARGSSSLGSLVSTAMAIGRMPGEPAAVLRAGQRPRLLTRIFGRKIHGPLADPRLEVIRAISASLSRGIGTIRADLITAAAKVGWSREDLSCMFPAILLRATP